MDATQWVISWYCKILAVVSFVLPKLHANVVLRVEGNQIVVL